MQTLKWRAKRLELHAYAWLMIFESVRSTGVCSQPAVRLNERLRSDQLSSAQRLTLPASQPVSRGQSASRQTDSTAREQQATRAPDSRGAGGGPRWEGSRICVSSMSDGGRWMASAAAATALPPLVAATRRDHSLTDSTSRRLAWTAAVPRRPATRR